MLIPSRATNTIRSTYKRARTSSRDGIDEGSVQRSNAHAMLARLPTERSEGPCTVRFVFHTHVIIVSDFYLIVFSTGNGNLTISHHAILQYTIQNFHSSPNLSSSPLRISTSLPCPVPFLKEERDLSILVLISPAISHLDKPHKMNQLVPSRPSLQLPSHLKDLEEVGDNAS